jgi:hypothetical protein
VAFNGTKKSFKAIERIRKMQNYDIIMYTVKDIRNIFKCSQAQAYDLVNANGFPSIRIRGKILIEKRALENWLDRNRGKTILM